MCYIKKMFFRKRSEEQKQKREHNIIWNVCASVCSIIMIIFYIYLNKIKNKNKKF